MIIEAYCIGGPFNHDLITARAGYATVAAFVG